MQPPTPAPKCYSLSNVSRAYSFPVWVTFKRILLLHLICPNYLLILNLKTSHQAYKHYTKNSHHLVFFCNEVRMKLERVIICFPSIYEKTTPHVLTHICYFWKGYKLWINNAVHLFWYRNTSLFPKPSHNIKSAFSSTRTPRTIKIDKDFSSY